MDTEIDRLAHQLRPSYRLFLEGKDAESILTGHSHQAWPNVAREAQLAAWDDAARWIDGKWDTVFGEVMPELRALIGTRLGTARFDDIALAPNTHELVYRLLSCFPMKAHVLTTNAEFFALDRQLRRSSEDGLRVTRVDAEATDFLDQMLNCIGKERPDLIAISQVLFTTARKLHPLETILEAAAKADIPVLVDVYHAYCAIPLEVDTWPGSVFVVGGGYKYAQCGEGNCFLLLPQDKARFRPRHTGWMAHFESLEDSPTSEVQYSDDGMRFFGATFDPTPLYRALFVLRWMDEQSLSPAVLRRASLLRTQYLIDRFDDTGLEPRGVMHLATPRSEEHRGGFVALRHPRAVALSKSLRARGVRSDARFDLLRFGPAPYTTTVDMDRAIAALAETLD